MSADLQRVSRPLMLVVVAAMVAILGACADREPTVEPAEAEGTAEELQSELGDELLEAEVALRLYAAIGADASGIGVEATDGTVSLGGKVDEEHDEAEALAAAREAAGVVDVLDRIEVNPPLEQPF